MNHQRRRQRAIWTIILGLLTLMVGFHLQTGHPVLAGSDPVQEAWERAQRAGAYRYAVDIVQTTRPLLTIENVGKAADEARIYIEGETDASTESMQLKLWSEGGSALTGQDSIELRIADGKAYGRVREGQWQEIDDVTRLFAPGHDMMGYLAGAENVRDMGIETRSGLALHRYRFDINGSAFADYIRRQTEIELQRTGELPTGLNLKAASHFQRMTGHGEIWLNERGLPIRQSVTVTFPPTGREQMEATIVTDFFQWAEARARVDDLGKIQPVLRGLQEKSFDLSITLFVFGTMILILSKWRSHQIYTLIVLILIASMIITPLLRAQKAYAFYENQQAQQAAHEQQQAQTQAAREARKQLIDAEFDPHANPLAKTGMTKTSIEPLGAEVITSLASSQGNETPSIATLANDQNANQQDTDGDGLTDEEEIGSCTAHDNADTDGDGLSDGLEMNELGTHPCYADTDGDGISDITEVEGFEKYGEQWYLDPLESDTNRDGTSDLLECYELIDIDENGDLEAGKRQNIESGTLTCTDTDGDGTPDVFDQDNDGDGVPDAVDLSPNTVVGGRRNDDGEVTGIEDGTFNFKLEDLSSTVDKPVFVDFQLRPTDPEHLWYSLSVLDWPSGDREGQIQRYFDTTFKDYNDSHGRESGDSDGHGDMRLIPMLEVEIPYHHENHYGNLPVIANPQPLSARRPVTAWLDSEVTDDFHMSIRYKNGGNQPSLLVYVPATLVRDRFGDSPVAFSARILYRPNGLDFGKTQNVRLIWMVEGLTDSCELPENADPEINRDEWCSEASNWQQNPPRILHTYYDEWYLTGLSVREDRGVEAGIIYEDINYYQAQDPEYSYDDYYERYLWQLAVNLDTTFITGRTTGQGQNQQRDVTVSEIENRFDGTIPEGDDRLWELPKGAIEVETFSFSDQTALATLPMTHTQRVLNDHFTDTAGQPRVEAPTLLFVREEQYRTANLEGIAEGLVGDDTIMISLDPSRVFIEVLAAMNWAPYRFDEVEGWQAYPIDEYWERMGTHYQTLFEELRPEDDRLVNAGRRIIAQNYYVMLYNGRSGVVKMGDTYIDLSDGVNDDMISSQWTGIASPPLKIAKEIIEGALEAVRKLPRRLVYFGTTQEKLLAAIGGARTKLQRSWVDNILDAPAIDFESVGPKKASIGTAVAIGAAVGGVVASITFAALLGPEGADAAFYVIDTINLVMAIKGALDVALDLFKQNLQGTFKYGVRYAIQTTKVSLKQASNVAAIIGLIVSATISVGFFIAQMISAGIRFGSLSFNLALAAVVAEILVGIIMFAIGLIPIIGQIIVAIVGLIDSIVNLVCTIAGLRDRDDLEAPEIGLHPCNGISGAMAKIVQFIIYDQTPLVDLGREERLNVYDFDIDLLDERPVVGFVKDNTFALGANVTTELHKNTPIGLGATYYWQFSNENLKKSRFAYGFNTFEDPLDITQGLSTKRPTTWEDTDPPMHTWDTIKSEYIFTFSETGINQKISAYLNEGYAMKAQECFMVPNLVPPYTPPMIPVCHLREKTDTHHIDLDLKFDIFPATVGQYFELTPKGGGYAQAWGQSGDLTFPVLQDADGDELLSPAFNGNDPSDRVADTDRDGLSDRYEAHWGSDPTLIDTDGDGLSDYDEWRYSTDPGYADSDHDGLKDGEEIVGWTFVYGFDLQGLPLETRVTSDPLNPDTDGDGMIDKLEQVYGLNPRVSGPAAPLSIESEVSEEDYLVKPGNAIEYTATITNELRNRYALGLLDITFPPAVQDETLEPQPYTLAPLGSTVMGGQITVDPLATSQQISLTNTAGAVIQNLQTGRHLWLHFDEPHEATTFADASLLGYDATCVSTCPTAGAEGNFIRAAQFDEASDRLISQIDVSEENYTLSLWFKTTCEDCGIFSAVNTHNNHHDRDIYLDGGNLCARLSRGSDSQILCTSGTDYGDGYWHHLAHTFGGAQDEQRLYVDGIERESGTRDTSNLIGQNAIYVGYSRSAIQSGFDGVIDELEIFPRVLNADEIAARFRQPVFHATFGAASADSYQDNTSHKHTLTCPIYADCPTAGRAGVIGHAASFNRRSYLTVSPGDNSLNLRKGDGHFTVSAWVYPIRQDNVWRGVVGRDDHDHPERTFPSILVNGALRRYQGTFGNGNQLCQVTSPPDVLRTNTWQHVVTAYDGTNFKLFVNGQEVASNATCAGTKPYNVNTFDIGRTGTAARLFFEKIDVKSEGDGSGSAEYNLFVDNTRIWGDMNVERGINDFFDGSASGLGYEVYGDHLHSIMLKELDESINEPARGGDDLLIYKTFFNYQLDDHATDYDEDGEGTLYWSVMDNKSFAGRLDDLRIYHFAFDEDDTSELFQAATRILELRFDEPPGAHIFRDSSGNGEGGLCDGDCPVSGLPGRSNQAVRFDRSNNHISVETIDIPQTDYTLSLWFRTQTYGDQCENCGLFSIMGDGGRDGHIYLQNGHVCAKLHGEEICSSGTDYADGQWHFVAHTVGSDVNGQRLIVDDGETITGNQHQATFGQNPKVRIGVSPAASNSHFGGAIDHVILTRKALNNRQIGAQRTEVPVLIMHLDDLLGATQFQNVAAPNDGTCNSAAGRCPAAGSDGWIYNATKFDSEDDVIRIPSHEALNQNTFSLGLWVYPAHRRSVRQTLVTRETNSGEQNYTLNIKPNSMQVVYKDCRQSLDSSPDALLEDQWNHIFVTHNGEEIILYVNGSKDTTLAGAQAPCPFGDLYLGGNHATYWDTAGSRPFGGSLDELTLFSQPLSRSEVEDLYNYQISWFDTSKSHRITVDAEPPVVDIALHTTVLNMDAHRMIEIHAEDETSNVERVQIRTNGGAWQNATQVGTKWLFAFTPSTEGSYLLEAQATDTVGHPSDIDSVTFVVDDSPPIVAVDSASTQQILSTRKVITMTDVVAYRTLFPATGDTLYASANEWWHAPSSGFGVRRPNNADVINRVDYHLSLINEMWEGAEATAELMINNTVIGTFNVQSGETTKDLSFSFPPMTRLGGDSYAIWLRIIEGNNLKIPMDQSRLTFFGPQAISSDRVTLSGSVSDPGGANVDAVWIDLLDKRGVSLGGKQQATLGDGRWQIDYRVPTHTNGRYTIRIEATDSVGNYIVREDEVVTIKGTPPDVDLTAAGDGSRLLTGIDAGAPVITGTVSDLPYPTGQELHFHFEEPPGAIIFKDASGREMEATCFAVPCPIAGEPGRFGNALRFSSGQTLTIENQTLAETETHTHTIPAFSPTDYTLAVWIKSDAATQQTLVDATDSVDAVLGIRLELTAEGLPRHIYRPQGSGETLTGPTAINDGRWHHLVAVKDGLLLALYVDGVRVNTATAEADIIRSLDVALGGSFIGQLDEFVIYDRALSGSELQALADPAVSGIARLELGFRNVKGVGLYDGLLLYLPFEELGGTTAFADLSTNSHWGWCTADSCPTPGEKGRFGRALAFDGIDDHINLQPVLLGGPLTMSAWVKPESTQGTQAIIYHGLGTDYTQGDIFLRIKDGFYEFGNIGLNRSEVARYEIPMEDVGQWVHLTGVGSPGQWEIWSLYRNGTYVANSTEGSIPSYRSSQRAILTIGANGTGNECFKGEIDEVTVYNRSLLVPAKDTPRLHDYVIKELASPDRWLDVKLDQPGAPFSTWHYTVEDREGSYIVDSRIIDQFGHATLAPNLWSGEIDTRAPRLDLYTWSNTYPFGFGTKTIYRYRCTAMDYNLTTEGLQCPGVSSTAMHNPICIAEDYLTVPWYTEHFSQTKLQKLTTQCSGGLEKSDGPQIAQACDIFDRCTTVIVDPFAPAAQSGRPPEGSPQQTQETSPIQTLILTPTHPSAFTDTAPVEITGLVHATNYLRNLTVTVNSVPTAVFTWTTNTVTATTWNTTWTPTAQGIYTLSVQASDWASNVITETPLSPVIYVDTAPPTLALTTATITSSDFSQAGYVGVQGRISDTVGVADLRVRYGDRGWNHVIVPTDTHAFKAQVWTGANVPPAGRWVTVTTRATDVASQTTTVSRTVWVDAVPPDPVTAKLSYLDSQGTRSIITPGITLRDVASPTLYVEWTASASTDVTHYLAGWTSTPEPVNLTPYAFTAQEHTQVVGEAQKLYAHVIVVDAVGNRTIQTLGPIYTDNAGTPAYITPTGPDDPYYGWLEDDCNLLGIDDRIARNTPTMLGLDVPQRFYVTWNTSVATESLNLTWTGADWNSQGDLFIYLDTHPGGTLNAYTRPYQTYTDTQILLPGAIPTNPLGGEPRAGTPAVPMEADSFIWISDNTTAWLWHWNGSRWITETQLSETQYRFNPAVSHGHTALHLPFSLLNLSTGDSLKLIAFATEDPTTGVTDGLRVWATMPPANPLNSHRAFGEQSAPDSATTFAMSRAYMWSQLGNGMCPNSNNPDRLPQVEVNAEPVGITYSFLDDKLHWMWDQMFAGPPPDISKRMELGDVGRSSLSHGQTVKYTLLYRNPGPQEVTGIKAEITAHYGLKLQGRASDHQTLNLGNVAAGETVTATFRGEVDLQQGINWAAADILIYDDAHPESGPPIEWIWIDHPLDGEAPQFFGISAPQYLIAADRNVLHGYAHDASGTPALNLAAETPSAGTRTFSCLDPTPLDGSWLCDWDTTALNGGIPPQDGDIFRLAVQVEDTFGHTSRWTRLQPLIVDTIPPTVTLETELVESLEDFRITRADSFGLRGEITDNQGLGFVEVCEEGICERADVRLTSGQGASWIDDQPSAPIPIDSSAPCVKRTFNVTDTFDVAAIGVGLNISHTYRGDLHVTLQSPSGTEVTIVTPTMEAARNYNVFLEDNASKLLHTRLDDPIVGSAYHRAARPDAPLRDFQTEPSTGTWTLTLCDADAIRPDGLYNKARLILEPRDTMARSGHWFYKVFGDEEKENYVEHTMEIYGIDYVGNRVSEPLNLTVVKDNVAPKLTVTDWPTHSLTLGEDILLAGTITDPGGVRAVRLVGYNPSGEPLTARVEHQNETWAFTDSRHFIHSGTYQIFLEAVDRAGNECTLGPLDLTFRTQPAPVYMPAILNDYTAPNIPDAPDLVMERLVVSTDAIALVIVNRGNRTAQGGFWVDAYLDPDPVPNAVNQIWPDLADQGLVWGVTQDLASREVITLTLGDTYYRPEYSKFSGVLSIGTWVYGQADSANANTNHGAILEMDELIDADYNNINALRVTASQINIGQEVLESLKEHQSDEPVSVTRQRMPLRH
jgi:type II secretory pathway pseudopilin PulG